MTSRRGGRFRWLASRWPHVGVEIAARRLTVVVVGHGRPAVVAAHVTEELPEGAIVPALSGANVRDGVAVTAALKRALEQVGARAKRVALVVPDAVAKVSLVRFEQVPARAEDLERLIGWQVRKAVPFRLEDAVVSWTPGPTLPGGGQEFVVALARRDVIAEYEAPCAAVGVHAGAVDLASFNVINVALAAGVPHGDWLLVHLSREGSTLVIMRGAALIFYRHRAAEGEDTLADLVHQTVMYYEDRLDGGGFARVFLAGAAASGASRAEQVRLGIEERLEMRVEWLDPRGAAALRDRITAAPGLLDELAAPLGLALRERVS